MRTLKLNHQVLVWLNQTKQELYTDDSRTRVMKWRKVNVGQWVWHWRLKLGKKDWILRVFCWQKVGKGGRFKTAGKVTCVSDVCIDIYM